MQFVFGEQITIEQWLNDIQKSYPQNDVDLVDKIKGDENDNKPEGQN